MTRTLILNTDCETTRQLRKALRDMRGCSVRVPEDLPEPVGLPEMLSAVRPDRILLGTDPPWRCRLIAAELERIADAEIIAVGRISDPDLLDDLAKHGIPRFLGWPFPPELVRAWLRPHVRTLQYMHGDTGRHRRHVDGPVVRP
jgi:hypothetical protein